jgi:hypothetical protein
MNTQPHDVAMAEQNPTFGALQGNGQHFNPDAYGSSIDEMVPKDDDRGVYATFHYEPVLLGFKSKAEGRPIYEDREFVRIIVRGNDKMVVDREATNQDKARFARQYAAFRQGEGQARIGTPLEKVSWISPATVRNYQHLHIYTVEDLAECGDNVLSQMGMGARDLRDKAKSVLSGGGSPLAAENAELKDMLKAMQARLEALEGKGEAADAPKNTGGKAK